MLDRLELLHPEVQSQVAPTPSPTSPPATQPEPTSTPASSSSQPASPSPSSSSSSSTSSSDIDAYLNGHNTFRSTHGASPLTWSDELASTAQAWASGCKFEHSHGQFGGTYLLLEMGVLPKVRMQRTSLPVPEISQFRTPSICGRRKRVRCSAHA
jgi:uncharacterized protein YkwD